MGVNGSNSSNSATSSQSIPGFQSSALNTLYGSANNLFNTTSAGTTASTPAAQNIVSGAANSAATANQSNLQGGAYAGLGTGSTLMDSLTQSLNTPSQTSQLYGDIMGGSGNDYADAMKASYTADANNASNNLLRNTDARAAAAGMSGSDQSGIAQGLGLQGINNNLQQNLAQTGYDTFNQNLQNQLGIAQQADSNTLARQQLLSSNLQNQQNTVNNAVGQSGTVQNLGMGTLAPSQANWANLGNWANTIGSPTVLTNGTSSGSGSSKGGGLSMS